MLTPQQLSDYSSEGYFLIEGMLSEEEVATFRDHARDELRQDAAAGNMMEKKDKEGNTTLLKMWYEAGDDMYGLVARDQRLVSIAQDLLQKDIYLYSHKMTVKEPLQGGAWEWHQDYRVLVREQVPCPRNAEHLGRSRQIGQRERLLAGIARVSCTGPYKPRPCRRAVECRP